MEDSTIDNALIALYKAGGEPAELARRILALRGVALPRLVSRGHDRFLPNQMRWIIFDALKDGPKTGPDIVRHVMQHRPHLTFRETRGRVSPALTTMKLAGMVRRAGRMWLLAGKFNHGEFIRLDHVQPSPPDPSPTSPPQA